MRLAILDQYQPTPLYRLKIFLSRFLFGPSTVDAARASYYRATFFARPYYKMQHYILRGPSSWKVSDRELFAAHTSYHNQCKFCTVAHSSFAETRHSSSQWVQDILHGLRISPSKELGAMLAFLEKLTKQPWNLTSQDIQGLRAVGLNKEQIEEAIMVCVNFSIGNRLADALDVDVPTPTALRRAKPVIRFLGYSIYT